MNGHSRFGISLCALALLATPAARGGLESHMAPHMLLQLPLLTAVGWLLAESVGMMYPSLSRLSVWNRHGLPGLLLALLATSFWMIPRAIDAARLLPWVEAAKFMSLLVAGAAMRCSWQAAGRIVQVFFLGNWCWMAAAAGLLYQSAPVRLCAVYLAEEQVDAGRGLVVLAFAAFIAWCIDLGRSGDLRRLLHDEPEQRSATVKSPSVPRRRPRQSPS